MTVMDQNQISLSISNVTFAREKARGPSVLSTVQTPSLSLAALSPGQNKKHSPRVVLSTQSSKSLTLVAFF